MALLASLASPLAGRGAAQEIPPTPPDDFPRAPEAASEPPGRFRLGPVYLTPTFRIGSIGLDTNVFYTATDRRTDLAANGGPGFEAVLPLARGTRILLGAGFNYVYFVRTPSQRKLGGDARAGVEWGAHRVKARAEEEYSRSFGRPSLEVDRRVLQDRWTTTGALSVQTGGRLGLRTQLASRRIDVAEGQSFLGADLHRTLSRDEHQAILGFRYRLTVKSAAILEGDLELDRFTVDPARDADSNRLYAGFEVDSQTRLSGRAVGGIRIFRPKRIAGADRTVPYAAGDLGYRVGPKTLLGASYSRDLAYSAFDTPEGAPTLTLESFGGRVEKDLVGRLTLQLWARVTRLRTDGRVTIERAAGDETTALRRDTAHEAGADLGYRVRPRLRAGIAVVYLDRRSTVRDFGISGLLVGGTLTYTPGGK